MLSSNTRNHPPGDVDTQQQIHLVHMVPGLSLGGGHSSRLEALVAEALVYIPDATWTPPIATKNTSGVGVVAY